MEGTYEYELERAELLGVEPISREKWEEQNKARLEAEREAQLADVGEVLESEGEALKGGHGKMDELNNILSATQQKINKFKTVCGSFTSLLRIRTSSPAPTETPPNGQAPTSSINDALDNLDKLKETDSDVQFVKKEVGEVSQKVSKNLDALDRLLQKTETAQMSMEHQNKQMKSYLNK